MSVAESSSSSSARHVWEKRGFRACSRAPSWLKASEYGCTKCDAIFLHRYALTLDLSAAPEQYAIPETCPPTLEQKRLMLAAAATNFSAIPQSERKGDEHPWVYVRSSLNVESGMHEHLFKCDKCELKFVYPFTELGIPIAKTMEQLKIPLVCREVSGVIPAPRNTVGDDKEMGIAPLMLAELKDMMMEVSMIGSEKNRVTLRMDGKPVGMIRQEDVWETMAILKKIRRQDAVGLESSHAFYPEHLLLDIWTRGTIVKDMTGKAKGTEEAIGDLSIVAEKSMISPDGAGLASGPPIHLASSSSSSL